MTVAQTATRMRSIILYCHDIAHVIQSVEDNIKQRMLGFIVSTANLPSDPRKILMARANSSDPKGVVKRFNEVLSALNLPDLSELLSSPPKTST